MSTLDPMLVQELTRFIDQNPMSEGAQTLHGLMVVKTVKAGVTHRMAIRTPARTWVAVEWTRAGLPTPQVHGLSENNALLATNTPVANDDDLAGLALYLVAANR